MHGIMNIKYTETFYRKQLLPTNRILLNSIILEAARDGTFNLLHPTNPGLCIGITVLCVTSPANKRIC
jgi:hypothetical protein